MKFVGREHDLAVLEGLYKAPGFQMPIIYGRRRVGKTTLIEQFAKDKRTIFFSARETTARENLRALSSAIAQASNGGVSTNDDMASPTFATFEDAFNHVFHLAKERRLLFVIDEYPYLANSEKSVSSVLQHFIDRQKNDSQLFLILCGSSMSFMEHQVLGYKSPLYGRRTAQIKVEPFRIGQAAKLLDGASPEDVVAWYGVVGGVPLYLSQYDTSLTLQDNLAAKVLRPDSFLYGEPDAFLQQEMRDPANYNAIIQAIAAGACRISEIADVTGIPTTSLPAYIKSLCELGIIKKNDPVVKAKRKRGRYEIADNLFRFWYRFIPRYLTPLQVGREKEIARLICTDHLSTFLGPAFEQVCRQWVVDHSGTSDIPLVLDIGSWWGTDPESREEADIDIVALCDDGSMVVGECKWHNSQVGPSVVKTLEHRSRLVKGDGVQHLFVFSKSGFTKACKETAAKTDCRLVSLNDMGL